MQKINQTNNSKILKRSLQSCILDWMGLDLFSRFFFWFFCFIYCFAVALVKTMRVQNCEFRSISFLFIRHTIISKRFFGCENISDVPQTPIRQFDFDMIFFLFCRVRACVCVYVCVRVFARLTPFSTYSWFNWKLINLKLCICLPNFVDL